MPFSPSDPQRFTTAIQRLDEENSQDPNQLLIEGIQRPRELIYAQWLTDWVLKLSPEASEPLRLAARSQHICRWKIPRSNYPMTRAGYLQWRATLKKFHAQKAGEILREVGYPEDMVARVQALNLKKHFPNEPESRVLEDALCLVFLEHQLTDLANKTSEDKVITALQKSWQKMTPVAREIAKTLSYPEREVSFLQKALA
jgi:hypothetical protein